MDRRQRRLRRRRRRKSHKRGFVRGLWGVLDNPNRITVRRHKMRIDIVNTIKGKHQVPYRTYVYGKENYDVCVNLYGLQDVVLLSEEPEKFDLIRFQFRHKLDILRHAMLEDGYDEVIYLDWDVSQRKPLNNEFWAMLNQKAAIQANLQHYKRMKLNFRTEDRNIVPNGGFLYLRDKTYPDNIIEQWDKHPEDTDEVAYGRWIDILDGGYRGKDYYWDHYECMVCNLAHGAAYPRTLTGSKPNVYFRHYQGQRVWAHKLENEKVKDVEQGKIVSPIEVVERPDLKAKAEARAKKRAKRAGKA